MTAAAPTRPTPLGVHASPDGSCAISGPALRWLAALDEAILSFAGTLPAVEYSFSPLISAAQLGRMDYFRSFPQLVTMPATVPADHEALQRFVAAQPGEPGVVQLPEHAPIEHALTPAACYPVYPALSGRRLSAPEYVTVRSTCFRRESHFVPLRRQWSFSMREIVVIGTAEEVSAFLARGRDLVDALAARLDLGVDWQVATDPFFDPDRNGKALLQRLSPTKNEAVVDDLAIASVNVHHDHFGATFDIARVGEPAKTGCVAFGLERWLGVAASRWGADPQRWPDPRDGSL